VNIKSVLAIVLLISSIAASAKVVDKIVAIVNDQVITLTDMEKYRKRLQGGGLVDDALVRLNDTATVLKDKNALLQQLINERILDSEVKKKGLEVTIERVEQEIRNIARNNNIDRNQLKTALQAKGVTMSQYQDFIKTSLERQALVEKEVSSKIRISDEDVSSYYLSKKGPSSSQVFEYTLAHILFNPKNGGEAGAMSRAMAVEEKLKTGQSFEKLAEQFSEDSNFSKGGLLGTFKAGEMLKELDEAVRNVAVGDVSRPVKTRMGIHIIKVLKRTLVSDPKLEEEKEEIRKSLYGDAFKRQFKLWLSQRRDESFIRINGF
jgi:peptidyl-prolyl cis-trans isomerase SurA